MIKRIRLTLAAMTTAVVYGADWTIESQDDWTSNVASHSNFEIEEEPAVLIASEGALQSVLKRFPTKLYYDYPNDQDPHLYIDEDLTDGQPGKNMGMAFKDPSNGSDCAFFRASDGRFHLIYEDWSPIDAKVHA